MSSRAGEKPEAPVVLDEIDRKIVSTLMHDGRITWADLASNVGLSPPSTIDRVRKLQNAGVIRGYVASLDPLLLGQRLLAFVFVALSTATDHHSFRRSISKLDEVQECHVLAGEYDYLLKVRCHDGQHLESFLRTAIRRLPGVERTNATITLTTTKESTGVKLD
jgi:Lrp/AsnC family leucine-responsive transcriptional regulator